MDNNELLRQIASMMEVQQEQFSQKLENIVVLGIKYLY